MGGRAGPVEDLLVCLFDRPDRVLTRRQLRDLGEAGDLLLRWGALVRDGTLTATACRSCGDDHPVDLEFDPTSRRWTYYCDSVGFVAVDEDDLVTFRFDPRWLGDRLAEGLRIGRPRRRELVPEVLWDLGDATLGGRPWSAFLARAVGTSIDPILAALRSCGGKLTGLVLASSADAPWNLALPHGHRFLPLRDVLEVRADRLEIATDVVLAGLRGRRTDKPSRDPGRPTDRSVVLAAFAQRQRSALTRRTLEAEAEAIWNRLAAERPDLRPPAAGTIGNIIRAHHRAWRAANPRSTK